MHSLIYCPHPKPLHFAAHDNEIRKPSRMTVVVVVSLAQRNKGEYREHGLQQIALIRRERWFEVIMKPYSSSKTTLSDHTILKLRIQKEILL